MTDGPTVGTTAANPEISISYMKVGEVVFRQGKKSFRLNIQHDVTALESIQLSVMLATGAMMHPRGCWNWEAYIGDHCLGRHFTIA